MRKKERATTRWAKLLIFLLRWSTSSCSALSSHIQGNALSCLPPFCTSQYIRRIKQHQNPSKETATSTSKMTKEVTSNSPTPSSPSISPITVGVLALQGSFREHSTALRRLPGVTALEVRSAEELKECDGLVIPGGESTTMALVAERWGLVGPLKEYSSSGKPLWGTCAGLIFLANRAVGASLLGYGEGERNDSSFTIFLFFSPTSLFRHRPPLTLSFPLVSRLSFSQA